MEQPYWYEYGYVPQLHYDTERRNHQEGQLAQNEMGTRFATKMGLIGLLEVLAAVSGKRSVE